jgi:hypothetical protein
MQITIIVSPISRGRFKASHDHDRVILKSSRQPLLDAARAFLAEGFAPNTRIAMRHIGADDDALTSTVGAAAKLTVVERNRGNGPGFEQWNQERFAAETSPVSFDDDQVSN